VDLGGRQRRLPLVPRVRAVLWDLRVDHARQERQPPCVTRAAVGQHRRVPEDTAEVGDVGSHRRRPAALDHHRLELEFQQRLIRGGASRTGRAQGFDADGERPRQLCPQADPGCQKGSKSSSSPASRAAGAERMPSPSKPDWFAEGPGRRDLARAVT
jgi:hypothetical protein